MSARRARGEARALGAAAPLVLLLTATPVLAGAPDQDLSRLAALTETAARSARRERVQGTVAYSDPAWRILFLTNGQDVLFVDPPGEVSLPEPGERLEVEGLTAFTVGLPGLANVHLLRSLGRQDLEVTRNLASVGEPRRARFLTLRASVREVLEGMERDFLQVVSGSTRHTVVLPRRGSTPLPVRGAEVDAMGVLVEDLGPFRSLAPSTLWLASRDSLRTTTPAPDLSRLDTLSLADAAKAWHRGEVGRLVRVRGRLAEHVSTDRFILADPSGQLEVRCDEASRLSREIEFLMTGFLAAGSTDPLLEDVTYRAVGGTPFTHGPARALPRIESLGALRALSAGDAERGAPVSVVGTVTFLDLDDEKLFLQHGSTAIYVHPPATLHHVRPGDRVRVTGRSAPGSLAAIVVEPEVEVLGHDAWPRATPFDAARLRAGLDDCRLVVLEARIRAITRQPRRTLVRVDLDGTALDVVLPPRRPAPPLSMLDARVRIRGAVSSVFNWRGELSHVEIAVADAEQIEVVEPASDSPFARALVPAREVLRTLGLGRGSGRVRVRAVVTAADLPGILFVRDGASPLRVSTTERLPLQPGDEVEVAGFPVPGRGTPVIEDASIRIVARGASPPPRVVRFDAVREGLHDSELVTLEATLLDSVRSVGQWRLILQAGDTVFDAVLAGPPPEGKGPDTGSRLRIDGIAIAHERVGRSAGTFTVQLRSRDDVTFLSPPPFWTAARARAAITILSLALLSGAVWMMALRRQVRRQTDRIRDQTSREKESDARYRDDLEAFIWQRTHELEEAQAELVRRERLSTLGRLTATVSHELRNPLGTIRGSLFVIGSAVRGKTAALDRALDRAERNVLRCDTIIEELLEYTRARELLPQATRLDPWLRDVLDEITIPAGLCLRRELTSGAVVRIDRARIQRLVVNLVSNACEALTASASHAAERLPAAAHDRLTVRTRVHGEQVLVSVSDNGPGIAREDWVRVFEPFYSTKSFGVGLGLAIVKQIALQHGGEVEVTSEPGRETTFTLSLPATLVEKSVAQAEPGHGGVE